jgi:hypothetical protein
VRVAVDEVGVEPDPLEQLTDPLTPLVFGTTSSWISHGSDTMSPTVMRGFSELYGSWKMIWMLRRSRRSSLPDRLVTSWPL